jgi:hypothetical protein
MPKPNREIATTAKGSGGSQRGTLCRWEALTSAATTAASATPKKIPRARFGCLRQAAPHKARNTTRPLICSHIAMIQKSSRRRDSWRLARLPRSYSTSTPGRAESAMAREPYRAHRFRCWCRQDAGQAPRSALTNSVRSRPDCSPRRAGRKCANERTLSAAKIRPSLPNEAGGSLRGGRQRPFVQDARRVPPQCGECHRRQPSLIPAYRSSDRQLSEFRIRDAFPLT